MDATPDEFLKLSIKFYLVVYPIDNLSCLGDFLNVARVL